MRITCTATDRGNVYQFFRDDDDSVQRELRPFVPLLLGSDCDLVIGDEHDAPGSPILTVGPFADAAENAFRGLARGYLASECPPGPPPPQILASQRAEKSGGELSSSVARRTSR